MLWIVGRTYSALETYLIDHGYSFGLFHDQRGATPKTRARTVYSVDFSSRETMAKSLQDLTPEVDGLLLAGYEQYTLGCAWLGNLYDAPAPNQSAAINASDKSAMRTAFWQSAPELAPAWQTVNSLDDLRTFAQHHGYPVVLKPTNLMKSLYVTINSDWETLQGNYQQVVAAIGTNSSLIVEAFLHGSMHSVAGFVNAAGDVTLAGSIVDCVTARDKGIDDSYIAERRLPSLLKIAHQQDILRASKRAVSVLGLRSVALHIEVMLTPTGPKIIEIGARLGGYRARMYDLACGLDLYGALLMTAYDQPVSLVENRAATCSVIELFPDKPGELASISGLQGLEQLPAVTRVSQCSPGKAIGPAKSGYRAAATITLCSDDAAAINDARHYIAKQMRVITA